MAWSEGEYLDCLWSERRAYAWVMRHHGGLAPGEARAAALERYPYEPSDASYRGLVFHDEAWHWAIHGDQYVVEHPQLADPSPEYQELG